MSLKKTICVDFDGVIHNYSQGWKTGQIYDVPVRGAIDWLLKMQVDYDIAIYSSRSKKPAQLQGMKDWLNYYIELKTLGMPKFQLFVHNEGSDVKESMKEIAHLYDRRYSEGECPLITCIEQTSITFPSQKPAAWLTIDDRAICFKGEFPTMSEIDEFKPWTR